MVMTSDETQIQIFANWPMSHAKRVTRDNRRNPEYDQYHVVAAIGKLRTDKNCPAGKSWPNHVKNEQHIGSEKTYAPKKLADKQNYSFIQFFENHVETEEGLVHRAVFVCLALVDR